MTKTIIDRLEEDFYINEFEKEKIITVLQLFVEKIESKSAIIKQGNPCLTYRNILEQDWQELKKKEGIKQLGDYNDT